MGTRAPEHDHDPLPGAVAAFRGGNRDAAATVDRLLRPRLLRYFQSGPWPRDEAEDLVQQTMALVFRNVDTLIDMDRFLPWLFAIARNVRSTSTGRWMTRRQNEAVGLDGMAEPAAPGEIAEREEAERRAHRLAALREALTRLPARQRQCLLLRSREQLSYDEIARTLQLSTNTVRNHIAQAKESLRRLLDPARGERTR